MSELKKQLVSWLSEIGEEKTIGFLKQCEIEPVHVDYVTTLMDDDLLINLNDVNICLPPKVYKNRKQYSKTLEIIEEAIRDNAEADDNICIRNISWKPLINFDKKFPNEESIDQRLKNYSANTIHAEWKKALERKKADPEGAITLARSLLESVCKHILDDRNINFNEKNAELSELYKATAKELNLAPEQHEERIFKQILGGCSGIVNGLGTLRNKLGDAHGNARKKVKPLARHAELAINLAGSMCIFLIETHEVE